MNCNCLKDLNIKSRISLREACGLSEINVCFIKGMQFMPGIREGHSAITSSIVIIEGKGVDDITQVIELTLYHDFCPFCGQAYDHEHNPASRVSKKELFSSKIPVPSTPYSRQSILDS